MAKQNVTFVERHLEKMILGVCGAILLAVCGLYLVQSPNTVELNGEPAGPAEFYAQLREKAEASLRAMKSVSFSPAPEEVARVEVITRNLRLAPGSQLPDQLEVAVVMPSPPVPNLEGGVFKKIELAQIVAPSKPVTAANSAGRSLAVLPPRTIISGDATPPQAPQQPANMLGQPQPEAVYWIALAATIDRKAQRERFEAAGYHEGRKALIIMGVEARRQMLLPNGEWGPDEMVKGYSPVDVRDLPTIQLERPENGEQQFIPAEQNLALEQFRAKISSYDQHQSPFFLRPAFQQELHRSNGDWWAWSVPRKLPGLDADLMLDYGVAYLDEEIIKPRRRAMPARRINPDLDGAGAAPLPGRMEDGGRGGAGRAPRRTPAAAAPVPAGNFPPGENPLKLASDYMKKGDDAASQQKFIDAERFWQAVATMSGAPEGLQKQATTKLTTHQDAIAQAYKDQVDRQARKELEMQMNFGPNIDPIWFTDTSITPGKTYRYQLRLLALNAYAGEPGVWYLQNIENATRLVIPGSWSDWSDPVTAKPDKQLFAWEVEEGKSVQIDLYQWSGKWQGGGTKVNVGEPIVWKSGRTEIAYGATIASIEPNRPYRKRDPKRDGTIAYADPIPTHAVVVVNAQGEAEEHLVAHDKDLRSTFNRDRLDEDRIRQEAQQYQPHFEIRSPVMPGGPMQIPTVGMPGGLPGGMPGALPGGLPPNQGGRYGGARGGGS